MYILTFAVFRLYPMHHDHHVLAQNSIDHKLSNFDSVLGGQQNQKLTLDFRVVSFGFK